MKKALKRRKTELYYYGKDNNIVLGIHTGLHGDCTGLRGNLDKCNLTDKEREESVLNI